MTPQATLDTLCTLLREAGWDAAHQDGAIQFLASNGDDAATIDTTRTPWTGLWTAPEGQTYSYTGERTRPFTLDVPVSLRHPLGLLFAVIVREINRNDPVCPCCHGRGHDDATCEYEMGEFAADWAVPGDGPDDDPHHGETPEPGADDDAQHGE